MKLRSERKLERDDESRPSPKRRASLKRPKIVIPKETLTVGADLSLRRSPRLSLSATPSPTVKDSSTFSLSSGPRKRRKPPVSSPPVISPPGRVLQPSIATTLFDMQAVQYRTLRFFQISMWVTARTSCKKWWKKTDRCVSSHVASLAVQGQGR